MIVAKDWLALPVTLHSISAVKEFADVTSNVLFDEEFAARVVMDKLFDVKDKLVQNQQLSTFFNQTPKFDFVDRIWVCIKRHNPCESLPVLILAKTKQTPEEQLDRHSNRNSRFVELVFAAIERKNTSNHGCLTAKDDKEAEIFVNFGDDSIQT